MRRRNATKRKHNKSFVILAVCAAVACLGATCSLDATVPPMGINYGYPRVAPPILFIDAEGLEDLDAADAEPEDTDE